MQYYRVDVKYSLQSKPNTEHCKKRPLELQRIFLYNNFMWSKLDVSYMFLLSLLFRSTVMGKMMPAVELNRVQMNEVILNQVFHLEWESKRMMAH